MDYGRIITRSFEIVRRYRAFWFFGFLLALMGEGAGSYTPSTNYNFGSRDFTPQGLAPGAIPNVPALPWNTIAVIVGVIICIVLIWAVLAVIVRLISRGAVIGLVNDLEQAQATPAVGRGWDIGVSRFGSLLGIALLINVPLTIISLLLVIVALVPLIPSIMALSSSPGAENPLTGAGVTGILGSIGLFCCVVLLLLVVQFVLHPFYQFFMRACVIGKHGATDSIREGYRLVRANLGNVAILYILTIALNFAFGIVVVIIGLILAALVLGPAFAIGFAAQSATPGVIVAIVIGLIAFLVLLFISGLYRAFESAIWTEGYLAVTAPKPAAPPAAPAITGTTNP